MSDSPWLGPKDDDDERPETDGIEQRESAGPHDPISQIDLGSGDTDHSESGQHGASNDAVSSAPNPEMPPPPGSELSSMDDEEIWRRLTWLSEQSELAAADGAILHESNPVASGDALFDDSLDDLREDLGAMHVGFDPDDDFDDDLDDLDDGTSVRFEGLAGLTERPWRHPSEQGRPDLEPTTDRPDTTPTDPKPAPPHPPSAPRENTLRPPDRRLIATMTAIGAACIAIGSVTSIAGIVQADRAHRSARNVLVREALEHTNELAPEMVVIRLPGQASMAMQGARSANNPSMSQASALSTSAAASAVSTEHTQAIVTDRNGTIVGVFDTEPPKIVEVNGQMWADSAALQGWDSATGVAVFRLRNRTNFRVPHTIEPDADDAVAATPTTLIDGLVVIECPNTRIAIRGNPVVAADGHLLGLIAGGGLQATDSAGHDKRFIIPYSTILDIARRLGSDSVAEHGN